VVVGHRAEEVRAAVAGRAECVFNPLYAETNSLYSLYLCRRWVRGDVIVLNCDVLADPEIYERLVNAGGSAFAYDSASGGEPEHMKVCLETGLLRAMSKELAPAQTHGENVGMLRFERSAVPRLFDEAEALLASGSRRLWLAAAVERLAQHTPLRGVDIAGLPWVEIDFPEDLARGRTEVWSAIRGRHAGRGEPASPRSRRPVAPVP
jgi:choline kinase